MPMECKLDHHKDILEEFRRRFPTMTVGLWWKKKEHSIRVRVNGGGPDLIFTYINDSVWSLKTVGYIED